MFTRMPSSELPMRENTADASQDLPQAVEQRRPYAPPRLRKLGSVRDLTLSGGSGRTDTDSLRARKSG
jgi:hypothetical protein